VSSLTVRLRLFRARRRLREKLTRGTNSVPQSRKSAVACN